MKERKVSSSQFSCLLSYSTGIKLTCSFLQLGHDAQISAEQDTPFPGLSGGTFEAATFALKISETNQCTAATYVGANSAFGTAALLVTFMGDGETIQRMCAYSVSTINDLMTQKFRDCLDGIGNGHKGFEREVQENCPMGLMDEQKQCVVSDQYMKGSEPQWANSPNTAWVCGMVFEAFKYVCYM